MPIPRILVVALLAVGLSLAPHAPAGAGPMPVVCGGTVTTDVVLTADLHCPTGSGIVVGADDLTVDLGGFELSGSIDGSGVSSDGFVGLIVRDGTISAFAAGVDLTGGSDSEVVDLTVELADSEESVGIALSGTTGSRVADNVLIGGGFGILAAADPVTNDGADDNEIEGNELDGVEQGITIEQSNDNTVTGNVARRHAAGIILAQDAEDNRIEDNDLADGLTGIYVDNSANRGNVIARNDSHRHDSAGIFIDFGQSETILLENSTDENDVGIAVRSSATTITRNQANRNAQLGIDAVAGVTDGGGNLAAGNGDPRQCVGVVCNAAPSPPAPPVGPTVVPASPVTPAPPAVAVVAQPRVTG